MSVGDFDAQTRKIDELRARERATVKATVLACDRLAVGASAAFRAMLSDGTGELALVFLGRTLIPGFVPGREVLASGTVAQGGGGLMILNPRYRFVPESR